MSEKNKIFKTILAVVFFLVSYNTFGQPAFSPTDISGLTVWLRADSNCLIFSTAPFIQQWSDSSGNNNNNAIQNISNQQPSLISNVVSLNNHNIIRFDGADDVLEIADNSSIDFTERMTIFIVAKQDVLTADKVLLGKWDYNTSGSWVLTTSANASELRMFVADSPTDPGNNVVQTNNGNMTAQYTIIGMEYKGFLVPANPIQFRKNLTPLNSDFPGNFLTSFINSTATLKIARFGGIIDRYYNGDIAEIIIYNDSLSAADRDSVEGYLHDKYAPPVNLGLDIFSSDFCPDTIDAGARFISFMWNTGDTTQQIVVDSSGVYWVTATDVFGFVSSDTINVSFPGNLSPPDTIICLGSSYTWDTGLPGGNYSFDWEGTNTTPADTNTALNISQQGLYWVIVTDSLGCFKTSDSITVSVDSFAVTASLGPDDSLCSGNTISLMTGAAQAQSYLWSDNSTNPYLILNATGTYTLTVTDTNGCVATDSKFVFLNGIAPTSSFTFTGVCENDFMVFNDVSTSGDTSSIISWFWNFGEPSSGTDDTTSVQNPSHQYGDTGVYNITLRVTTNTGCYKDSTIPVHVYPKPVPNFSTSVVCENAPTLFTDTTNTFGYTVQSYAWNFGDPGSGANNFSSDTNGVHIYSSPGVYVVTLTVTNIHGCTGTATIPVTVNASATPAFTYAVNCFLQPMSFQNLTTGTYSSIFWDFGDGSPGSPSPGPNILHLYPNPGSYTVTLSCSTTAGCISQTSQPVTVNPLPNADFDTVHACVNSLYTVNDLSSVSQGTITSWYWTLPGNVTDTSQNPAFIFANAQTYPVTLIAISQAGCRDTITKNIQVYPQPVADFGFLYSYGDAPLTEPFGNTSIGAISYLWDFGDTTPTDTATNPVHTYYNYGDFQVTLIATSPNGCMDTMVKYIYVLSPLLDLGVNSVSISNGTNYISVTANLRNLGNLEILNYKISATLENRLPVFENVIDNFLPGDSKNYTFNANFEISSSNPPEYLCVEATYPNNQTDDNPANNVLCINLSENFVIVDPYPNPSTEIINLLVVAPHKERLEIDVFDAGGKLIRNVFEGTVNSGLNKFTFDSSSLSEGVYFCRFSFLTKTFVKPLTHIAKNK